MVCSPLLEFGLVSVGKCCRAESPEEIFERSSRAKREFFDVLDEMRWWGPALETIVFVGELVEELLDDRFLVVRGCLDHSFPESWEPWASWCEACVGGKAGLFHRVPLSFACWSTAGCVGFFDGRGCDGVHGGQCCVKGLLLGYLSFVCQDLVYDELERSWIVS